ncbi:MAG: hypothetical protein HY397_03215, partial [Candidatus Doudnabacteria bacterium]|nr:hypothetical protein [Candidatus Doudnabacteria bacterium]
MKTPKLMVVDGNSLVHRGFHAIPHLSTSKGFPSNGVYGFVTIFLNALKKIQPDYIAVTFDLAGPTFRDKLYKDYKATRVKAPQELYDQIPKVKEFIQSLGLPVFEQQGYEADDVIGTIVEAVSRPHPPARDGHPLPQSGRGEGGAEVQSVIVTGDLDTLQLVGEHTKVFTTKKGLSEIIEYDERGVFERYGFGPEYVADYKALRGDPSDNIPGVAGIGDKGAIELVKKFGHVEDLYGELESAGKKAKGLPAKLKEKLLAHKAECLLSKKLAIIDTKVPMKFSLEKTRFGNYDASGALKFLQEMEFKSLLDKLPRPLSRSPGAGETSRGLKQERGSRAVNKNYHLIKDQSELDRLVKKLGGQKGFVVDTETTSERELEAKLLGVSVSCVKGEAYYVPFVYNPSLSPLTLSGETTGSAPPLGARGGEGELDVSKFKTLLEDKRVEKWGHNMKYDFLVLNLAGISLQPLSFDTMIAAYVVNPGSRSYGLDNLAFTRFGHQMIPIELRNIFCWHRSIFDQFINKIS